jgi:hypothetical protein
MMKSGRAHPARRLKPRARKSKPAAAGAPMMGGIRSRQVRHGTEEDYL